MGPRFPSHMLPGAAAAGLIPLPQQQRPRPGLPRNAAHQAQWNVWGVAQPSVCKFKFLETQSLRRGAPTAHPF